MTNEFEYQTGIVGAGWLGLPLARALQEQGQSVAVTVSTAEKAERLRGRVLPPGRCCSPLTWGHCLFAVMTW